MPVPTAAATFPIRAEASTCTLPPPPRPARPCRSLLATMRATHIYTRAQQTRAPHVRALPPPTQPLTCTHAVLTAHSTLAPSIHAQGQDLRERQVSARAHGTSRRPRSIRARSSPALSTYACAHTRTRQSARPHHPQRLRLIHSRGSSHSAPGFTLTPIPTPAPVPNAGVTPNAHVITQARTGPYAHSPKPAADPTSARVLNARAWPLCTHPTWLHARTAATP